MSLQQKLFNVSQVATINVEKTTLYLRGLCFKVIILFRLIYSYFKKIKKWYKQESLHLLFEEKDPLNFFWMYCSISAIDQHISLMC